MTDQASKEMVQIIEQYIEQESEKWVQHTLNNAKTISDLMSALWENGKAKKDGTEVERMLHRLIYERGAAKIKNVIKEAQDLTLGRALSPEGDSATC
ncbi:hypothetical protein C289_2063 [Anoxybacillus ayderensis]|uniref:hypothetical protein n=1 Tax=Anoxybacillaceae TaxID=3120669 RepID=UPI000386E66E|nr:MULTISPECIES: hypothetical protein [Bacillaceae]AMQ19637.1 hypothetical protein A0V43_00050 [Geobacillus sp. JS12]EPZ37775.1 hypothetical protein C289_2063 [Anoxybacillus ayderensis]MED4922939.1 hypothetical protein [Anoxybacillus geothermalis]